MGRKDRTNTPPYLRTDMTQNATGEATGEELQPWEQGERLTEDDAHRALLEDLDSGDEPEQPISDEPVVSEEAESVEDTEPENEEETDDASEEEPEYHPVTVDGEEYEVTLEEALAGYSREQDYTRKRQAAAEEHRAEMEQARGVRDEYGRKLEVLEGALRDATPHAGRTAEEWEALRAESPERFVQEFSEAQLATEKLRAVQAERERVRREQWEEAQAGRQEVLDREREALVEAVPEWSDPEAQAKGLSEIQEYAQSTYGWTPEQLSNVTDHNIVLALRKAKLWDESQSQGRAAIREKVDKAPRLRPGGKSPRPKNSGKKRIRKLREEARKGSEQAALDLIMETELAD